MDEDTTQAPEEQAPVEAQPTPAEETAPEPKEETPEAPAEPEAAAPVEEEAPEEVNLEEYSRERYRAPTAQPVNEADEIARELANLPADETGTVAADAAAKWFADKLAQSRAEMANQVRQIATQEAMAIVSESSQQQQLLKKYPEITKDKNTLDTIFDLRDAAALRGEGLTLEQAAAKLDIIRKSGKSEGEQSAKRRTTVQATSHLETTSNKGETENEAQRLAAQAFHGSGDVAKKARQEFLKGFVQREIETGRIQTPS